MQPHKYILEPYKGINSRYDCPECKKRKIFTRYIEADTNKQISSNVGRCNREIYCGYHYTPKQYFEDNKNLFENNNERKEPKASHIKQQQEKQQKKQITFIPEKAFKQSLNFYSENNFVKFLTNLFGVEITNKLIQTYFIGTSKHWNGATVFWQIDITGNIRTGKIMLYDSIAGKRIKKPFNHINWVHRVIGAENYNLQQCIFGEHLLNNNTKPVAIVESEKTAIIASVYLPKFIWLAVGSLSNLTSGKCNVLKGRNVSLFPDLNCYNKWKEKARELQFAKINISDLLERKANEAERKQGFDLADYLIKHNHKQFITKINQMESSMQSTQTEEQNILEEAIKKQFSKLNPAYWIIDKEKEPELTDYNLKVLVDDLKLNYEVETNSENYYLAFKRTLAITK